MASSVDRDDFSEIASEMSLDPKEVEKIVVSFFDAIVSEARSLPFATPKRVYSKEAFDKFGSVHQIPSVGRLGPSYTRYRQWKSNDSKSVGMVNRSAYDASLRRADVERIAVEVLSGGDPDIKEIDRQRKGKYNKVWHVGPEGRRLAWQAIKKK